VPFRGTQIVDIIILQLMNKIMHFDKRTALRAGMNPAPTESAAGKCIFGMKLIVIKN